MPCMAARAAFPLMTSPSRADVSSLPSFPSRILSMNESSRRVAMLCVRSSISFCISCSSESPRATVSLEIGDRVGSGSSVLAIFAGLSNSFFQGLAMAARFGFGSSNDSAKTSGEEATRWGFSGVATKRSGEDTSLFTGGVDVDCSLSRSLHGERPVRDKDVESLGGVR